MQEFKILFILVAFDSAVSVCVSNSVFASLISVPIGFASSTVGIKICEITSEIKKYMSVIKKKRKKHDKIVLLGITKLDTIEVLIS